VDPQPDTIPCPFCAEPISPKAVKCKHCRSFLEGGEQALDPAEFEPLKRGLMEQLAAAGEPADTRGQPGKFRTSTWVLTLLLAGSITLTALAPRGSDAPLVFGVLGIIVFGLVWLFLFLNDLAFPSVKGRSTPLEGVQCFLKAVRYGRWKSAFACLSPMARRKSQVVIPQIPELDCQGGVSNFMSAGGVKQYWQSIARPTPGFGTFRRVSKLRIYGDDQGDERIRRYRVSLTIEYYPQWIILTVLIALLLTLILYLVLRKYHTLEFDVVVYRHKSQWWVLTGEYDLPLDGAAFREMISGP
jgi:hypothetical protein